MPRAFIQMVVSDEQVALQKAGLPVGFYVEFTGRIPNEGEMLYLPLDDGADPIELYVRHVRWPVLKIEHGYAANNGVPTLICGPQRRDHVG